MINRVARDPVSLSAQLTKGKKVDRKELAKQEFGSKIPAKAITFNIETGDAWYYDYHGVSFVNDLDERLLDEYLEGVLSEKVGFAVHVPEWTHSGNGKFWGRFERVV